MPFDVSIDNSFMLVGGLLAWLFMLSRKEGASDRLAAKSIADSAKESQAMMKSASLDMMRVASEMNKTQRITIEQLGGMVLKQDHDQSVVDALNLFRGTTQMAHPTPDNGDEPVFGPYVPGDLRRQSAGDVGRKEAQQVDRSEV